VVMSYLVIGFRASRGMFLRLRFFRSGPNSEKVSPAE
jgi:hypothetical protein